MFNRIDDFLNDWAQESALTSRIMGALTDASLSRAASKDDWSLGKIAWHIATSIPHMLELTSLPVKSTTAGDPMPPAAAELAAAYKRAADDAARAVRDNWTDDTLATEDNMFGMMWPRGMTLQVLIRHQIHHRAQMTVLMRLAGLRVPGIYGPAREEWAERGMPAPELLIPTLVQRQLMSHKKQLILFCGAIVLMTSAAGVNDSVFNNFLSDTYHMSATARGWLELPRELPGFLVLLTAGLLAALPMTRVGSIAALLYMAGTAGLAVFGGRYGAMIAVMMVASTGLHLLQPVSMSVTLALSSDSGRGKRIGQVGMFENTGIIIGTLLVWLMFDKASPQYWFWFTISAFLAWPRRVYTASCTFPISLNGVPRSCFASATASITGSNSCSARANRSSSRSAPGFSSRFTISPQPLSLNCFSQAPRSGLFSSRSPEWPSTGTASARSSSSTALS